MSTIATIGAGNIATAIARLAATSAHEIVLSNSRGPETLADRVRELGGHVRAATTREAVAQGDVVVLTVPLAAVATLPSDLLDGKTVIDTVNYYPQRDGQVPELDQGLMTTSEFVARHFPGARIVKGFNNIVHSHLAALGRPVGSPERSVLPIAGDDDEAKATVAALLDDLGYDVLDTGALGESWRFERDKPAYCLPYAADPEALLKSAPGHRPIEAKQVTSDTLEACLAEAVRTHP